MAGSDFGYINRNHNKDSPHYINESTAQTVLLTRPCSYNKLTATINTAAVLNVGIALKCYPNRTKKAKERKT